MGISVEQNLISVGLEATKKNLKTIINNDTFWQEFINTLSFGGIDNETIILFTKNLFSKQVLTNDFINPITKELNKTLDTSFKIRFETKDHVSNIVQTQTIIRPKKKDRNINADYTFDNFIVSEFNKTAYNAAQSLFKKTFWNPIFISGGVGLGKTHLLHAIGNEFQNKLSEKTVKYVTSDEFIREVYNALSPSSNNIEIVKDKYQSYDLLLLDDIQFLAKKDKINEIFFNIFNHNVAAGQIIVMTSDKEVSSLDYFEDRMKSRFASGLMIKIGKPDLISIKNILQEKIKESEENFQFTSDAINFMVHRNNNDIRRLEGYLHRVLFFAINNLPPNAIIDVNTIQSCIERDRKEDIKSQGYDIDPNLVINQMCSAYSIDSEVVKSKIRTKQATLVRKICMHALRQKFNMPYNQIGQFFSGRHHTTVIDAVEEVNKMLKQDPALNTFLSTLYKKL